MLTIIVVVLLLLWLFGNYAPVRNGSPFIGGGPYVGGLGTIILIVLVVYLLFHAGGTVL